MSTNYLRGLRTIRNVFEHFLVKKRAGYKMIQPGASCTHHNSGLETCEWKLKMISEQERQADHLLQDDDLGLEAKALLWAVLAANVEAEVTG